jgi:ParB family chromosome partitioning protein
MDESRQPEVSGPVFLIEVDKIKPNPHQPRRHFGDEELRELANSIREFGVLQPLVVTKLELETPTGTDVEYQLIAGERRLQASRLAGLERVPAVIRNVALDRERLELAIVENIQRVDLNPIEAARAYAKLQDQFGMTQREIAARLGKSREAVANTMRLLSLPNQMQDAVARGEMSESQARLVLMVPTIPEQEALFQDVVRHNIPVRELRVRVQRIRDGALPITGPGNQTAPAPAAPVSVSDPELVSVERELEEVLGAAVRVERAGTSGKITITFYSPEELHGIVDKLKVREPQPSVSMQGDIPPPSVPSLDAPSA